MGRPSTLRASDADRELITERLRKAAAEGRLFPEELEQRRHTNTGFRSPESMVAAMPAAAAAPPIAVPKPLRRAFALSAAAFRLAFASSSAFFFFAAASSAAF